MPIAAFMMLVALISSPASAQGGPPQYVRDAVDGTLQMLRSDDDGAAASYVDEVMTGVSSGDRGATVEKVAAIKASIGSFPDGVDVEGRPGGVTLLLETSDGMSKLHLDIVEDGVTDIRLEKNETEAANTVAPDLDGRVEQHLAALERIHKMDWNEFVQSHLSANYRSTISQNELNTLREQLVYAAENSGSAGINVQGDIYQLLLGGPEGRWEISFGVEEDAPFGIRALRIADAFENLTVPEITRDNIRDVLADLGNKGFDGAVYVKLGGEELLKMPIGYADRSLERPMTYDKIFGTGSQPIDYTVALAHIAESQGLLSLDDPISKYVGEVPVDKASMTLRHLLDDVSGLPDFLDNEDDWDPDLSWITRDELTRRVLAAELKFEPGLRYSHSHAGYSFLAALVEIAVGKPYYEYLKEEILDPAGMTHTALYGNSLGYPVEDFAVGGGPSKVGLPNIPPNWGPTSWLVKGSGGMYSTMDDLRKLVEFAQTSPDLPRAVRDYFSGVTTNFNGSLRGFEMFETRQGTDDLIMLLSNSGMQNRYYRDLATRLEQLMEK